MEYESPKKEEKPYAVYEEYNNIYYMIPKDKDSYESFLSIDRQTKVAVRERFGIKINSDWECYTIASVYLSSLSTYVMNQCKKKNGEKVTHLFYDMLIVQSSYKKNPKAEKTGSLNIIISPGEALAKIRNNPNEFWEYDKSSPEDIFMPQGGFGENAGFTTEACLSLDKVTRMVCYKTNSIMIPDHYKGLVTAVAYTFFEMVFKHIIHKTLQSESEPKLERILMGETLDVNGFETEDGVIDVTLIPGANLKIVAKADDVTENDE